MCDFIVLCAVHEANRTCAEGKHAAVCFAGLVAALYFCCAALQALAMSTDVVLKPNPDALTLEDFGVTNPFKMEECAINIVRRFRTVQHFGFVKGYH